MKTLRTAAGVLCLLVSMLALSACSTGSPNVRNYFNTFVAQVNATPEQVTAAAKQAVEEMKMLDITAASTKVDGKVRAQTALHDEVEINIELNKDNTSEMSIRIGDAGDEAASRQIWERVFEVLKK
jgi:hypothetical protein